MGLLLKQSTAVDVQIGPFLDSTDGNTEEGGLTITQGDVLLSKNGAAWAQKNDATACTVDATNAAFYKCPLNATDTGTLGRLQLAVHESGSLYVYHEYMVVTANEYDSSCSTDYKQVDVIQVGGAAEDISTETKQDIIDGNVDAILVDTAALDGRLTDARAGYLDELAAANLPTDVANVKAETVLIVADTNELQTDWANGGRLDTLLDTTVSQTVAATVADAVLDEVVDANAPANCNSLRETVNVIASAVAGKCSGVDTDTPTFRDLGDTKNRLVTAIDANDNRTASTPDGT